jgi:peptide/nickel transport system substrate-binding protein
VLQGDYQAVPWQFDGFLDPDQQTIFWGSATAAPVGQYGPNFGRLRNPELDELMAQARGTASEEERRQLYGQVAQIIIDEVPWVYETRQITVLAAEPGVGGLGSFPTPEGGEGVEYVQGIIRVATLWQGG